MPVLQQGRYQVRMRIVQIQPTPKSQDLKSKGDLALPDVDWGCPWPRKAQEVPSSAHTPAKVSQPEPRPQLHIYPGFACTH